MPEKEDVIIRLQSLGYDINEGDGVTLENAIRETVHYIKAYCNIKKFRGNFMILPWIWRQAGSSGTSLLRAAVSAGILTLMMRA